jgi:hypothetical protein
MSRTYRHRPFDYLPMETEYWIDHTGEMREYNQPADGWASASKHFRADSHKDYQAKMRNKRVRRDTSYAHDWDNYTLVDDKLDYWD